MRVDVQHGRVDVRPRHGTVVLLGPGDSWTPPSAGVQYATAPDRPTIAEAAGARAGVGSHTRRGFRGHDTDAPDPAEAAFVRGWSAFRAGRWSDAVAGFDEVLRRDPGGALAEDAAYWRAIALSRAGSTDAGGALRGFLRDHPRSPHAPEAAVMLGRRSLAAGQSDEAAGYFRAALKAPASMREVRRNARAGLADIARAAARTSGGPGTEP
jgi:TolA-binding protein